tara:strand:+ start:430 stop:678 length:249 start_codon:yes stop_codon:yes gene_type:complete
MKNSYKTDRISKLKLINVLIIIFGFNLTNIDSKAHLKGYYLTESEAKEQAKDLGCNGTFKLKKMWMPCENEKELHKYLRKDK